VTPKVSEPGFQNQGFKIKISNKYLKDFKINIFAVQTPTLLGAVKPASAVLTRLCDAATPDDLTQICPEKVPNFQT
jgi:hypothetical protein